MPGFSFKKCFFFCLLSVPDSWTCGLLRCLRTTNTTGCSCLLPDPAYKQAVTAAPIAPVRFPRPYFFVPSPLCVPVRSPTSLAHSLTHSHSLATLPLFPFSPLPPPPLFLLSLVSLSFALFPYRLSRGLLSGTRRSGVGDKLQRRLTVSYAVG